MNREIKIAFVFRHPESKEVKISRGYTVDQLINTYEEEIRDECCHCECTSVGESNVVECGEGCDYYNDFEVIDKIQFTGLKDVDGKDYCLNDIIQTPNDSVGVLVWFDDCFGIGSGEANNYHAIDQTTKYELSECRIIGNIHQHPELLCSQQ